MNEKMFKCLREIFLNNENYRDPTFVVIMANSRLHFTNICCVYFEDSDNEGLKR